MIAVAFVLFIYFNMTMYYYIRVIQNDTMIVFPHFIDVLGMTSKLVLLKWTILRKLPIFVSWTSGILFQKEELNSHFVMS